jgi:hypothetical protein
MAWLVLSWLVFSCLSISCLVLASLCLVSALSLPRLSLSCLVLFLFSLVSCLGFILSCFHYSIWTPIGRKGTRVRSCLVLSFWCYLCFSLLVLYLCCLFSTHLVFWSCLCRCQFLSFGLCVVSLSLFWSFFSSLSYFFVFVKVQPF